MLQFDEALFLKEYQRACDAIVLCKASFKLHKLAWRRDAVFTELNEAGENLLLCGRAAVAHAGTRE